MKKLKTLAVWLLLIVLFFVLYRGLATERAVFHQPLDQFIAYAEDGRFSRIWVNGGRLEGEAGREIYGSIGQLTNDQIQHFMQEGTEIEWGARSGRSGLFSTILLGALPLIVILAGIVYFARKSAQSGAGNILSLRRSTARELSSDRGVTFSDVGGCVEAKELLQDVIDYLKEPARWVSAGARPPRGVLLEGPPGCGKTLLARAVAGETSAAFFVVSASEFVEMFVGVGAARVRDLFEQAAKKAPAVVFIDELDAMGRRRGSGIGSAHDEREQTLNQLLVSLDGFQNNARVVVIAATNRPDVLDRALLRPGRFDRRIKIPALSAADRLEILRIHTKGKRLDADVSLADLADRTDGMTGADIESAANEAALKALRRLRSNGGEVLIGAEDFASALRPLQSERRRFDYLDLALIESSSQLTEPGGKAFARITGKDGQVTEGELVWCDAAFIKLRSAAGEVLVPKIRLEKIEALAGTDYARNDEMCPDQWAGRQPGLA